MNRLKMGVAMKLEFPGAVPEIPVRDINEAAAYLYRLWSTSKAKLISEPESKPWGLHEFMAKDVDGNLFRVFYDFGTPESGNDA
jgi:hypothetical protein